jgi:drug/metabolite transporter (DMT)-like permease
MSQTASFIALAVSLASVSISQLIFKARLTALSASSKIGLSITDTALAILEDKSMWVGGVFLIVGFLTWYLAMMRLPLSLMLPMSALIAPVASIAAFMLLGEHLSPAKFAAIMVIVAGAAWLGWLNA